MKKLNYISPALLDFGTIEGITAVRGQLGSGDVEINTSGRIVDIGELSIDLCQTTDQAVCDGAR